MPICEQRSCTSDETGGGDLIIERSQQIMVVAHIRPTFESARHLGRLSSLRINVCNLGDSPRRLPVQSTRRAERGSYDGVEVAQHPGVRPFSNPSAGEASPPSEFDATSMTSNSGATVKIIR